ncbi:MAG TPA: hypothetical protein VLA74_00985, partial [Nitrososphaeraceae archaeon]|nr:hypothetical protein [Nitrososphaeraceae archaeon]
FLSIRYFMFQYRGNDIYNSKTGLRESDSYLFCLKERYLVRVMKKSIFIIKEDMIIKDFLPT